MVNQISLESVSAAFNHWREHRASTKDPIPLALQKQAIELLRSHSQSRVINALKIDHTMLKRWQQQVAAATEGEFISLTAAAQPALTQPSLQVVLRNTVGGELIITGITLSQITTLATYFSASTGEPL